MSDLTYEKDGNDIKTSLFLKNRGSCCKTSCLHCPYGFTLKKEGLILKIITDKNYSEAKKLAPKNIKDETDIAARMLASAFGGNKAKPTLSPTNRDEYLLVKIKGETCALVRKKGFQVIEIYYQRHFENQGITKEMVSSFLV